MMEALSLSRERASKLVQNEIEFISNVDNGIHRTPEEYGKNSLCKFPKVLVMTWTQHVTNVRNQLLLKRQEIHHAKYCMRRKVSSVMFPIR